MNPFRLVTDWKLSDSPAAWIESHGPVHEDMYREPSPPAKRGLWSKLVGGSVENPSSLPAQNSRQSRAVSSQMLPRELQHFGADVFPEVCVFGYELNELPESISDAFSPGGVGDVRQQVQGELLRWCSQLQEFHVFARSAISIRLLGGMGQVRVAILARCVSPRGASSHHADALDTKILDWMRTRGIRFVPLHDRASLGVFQLMREHVFEARQCEQLVPLRVGGELLDAYCVHPLGSPTGDWLELYASLANSRSEVLVSLHMETTVERASESSSLAGAASIAAQLEQVSLQGQRVRLEERSPNAPLVYRSLQVMEQRLRQPFLAVAQVSASNDVVAATFAKQVVANAVRSAPTKDGGYSAPTDTLPPLLDVVHPHDEQSRLAAKRTFESLLLTDWIGANRPIPSSIGMQRIRYLTDATSAACLVRLPVSLGRGIPGVRTYKPKTGYETGPRVATLPSGHILLGHSGSGSVVSVQRDDLTKHALICGQSGSGKTNTCLNVLSQLWTQHGIPFWVIEPPKREYRGLLKQPGFESALLFTVGDESVAPLRLNPFELMPSVSVAEHVQRLKVCFEAGLPGMDKDSAALVMLVNHALDDIYGRFDWRSTDRYEPGDSRSFPTMYDFLTEARRTVEGYAAEVKANLGRALENRIGSFLKGPKGSMFNVERGLPVNDLLTRPVVFELASMGEEAALVIMFLLMTLREQALMRTGSGLQHLVLVEEAHAVMRRPTSDVGPAAGAARAFGDMLAEMRGAGEGVILADQLPGRLVDDAIGNTFLKVTHQLSKQEEVEAIASSMAADDDHIKQMVRLRTGEAATFMGGMEGLVFITVPPFKRDSKYDEKVPNGEVKRVMRAYYDSLPPDAVLPYHGCRLCRTQCKHRADVEPVARDQEWRRELQDALDARARARAKQPETPESRSELETATARYVQVTINAARDVSPTRDDADIAWCFLTHRLGENVIVTTRERREFDRHYAKLVAR